MKKILVTGGCGYIGSHVARAFKLADANNEVVIIDQVERPHTLVDIDQWRIDDFASEKSLNFIVNYEFDIIVHCAGTSLVGPSIKNPDVYWDNNVVKTKRLLDRLKDLINPPIIMFSSSASVYGEPEQLPIPESHSTHPLSPYGNTKLTIEYMLADYCRAYNMKSVVFRYFNAAGARSDTNDSLGQEPNATHIIARALESLVSSDKFTLYGSDYETPDGTCIRDYVHVWDIAQAHIRASEYCNRPENLNNYFSVIFNLGTGEGISNRQIIDYVQDTYGKINIISADRRSGDPERLIADPKKSNDQLNWIPKYSQLSTIIDSAYKWYYKKVLY